VGITGATGVSGATGPTGVGTVGATGAQGATGATGAGTAFTAKTTLGPARRRYLDGTTGATTQDVFYQDVFNVKDYGAYGNGSNDDAASINAAITAALAATKGGAVYFPAGSYYVGSLITVTATKNIAFIGDGPSSEILMQSSSGLFRIILSSEIAAHFRSLTILAKANGVGIAINGPTSQNTHSTTMLLMEGVRMGAVFSGGWNYFTTALAMSYVYNAVIDNCIFANGSSANPGKGIVIGPGSGASLTANLVGTSVSTITVNNGGSGYLTNPALVFGGGGGNNAAATANMSGGTISTVTVTNGGTGYTTAPTITFVPGLCTNFVINNTNINFFDTGIDCPSYQEGLVLTNCLLIDVVKGIVAKSSIGLRSTNLMLVGTHIDARGASSVALDLENWSAVYVSSCLFIAAGTYNILLKRVFESSFVNSQIYGATTYGITLTSATVAAYRGVGGNYAGGTLWSTAVIIIGNSFRGPTSADILATADSSNIVARSNNRSDDNFSNSIAYLTTTDNGDDNQIEKSVVVGVNGTLYRTSVQTFTNSSETPVTWQAERYDGEFGIWNAGNPTRLNVPSGVKRVRVSAGTYWEASADGQFVAKIKDNSGNSWARDNRYGTNTNGTGSATMITPIIDIPSTGITYFELFLTQTTGGDLDLQASQATYFTLEVL
jgi:hypothetical protein